MISARVKRQRARACSHCHNLRPLSCPSTHTATRLSTTSTKMNGRQDRARALKESCDSRPPLLCSPDALSTSSGVTAARRTASSCRRCASAVADATACAGGGGVAVRSSEGTSTYATRPGAVMFSPRSIDVGVELMTAGGLENWIADAGPPRPPRPLGTTVASTMMATMSSSARRKPRSQSQRRRWYESAMRVHHRHTCVPEVRVWVYECACACGDEGDGESGRGNRSSEARRKEDKRETAWQGGRKLSREGQGNKLQATWGSGTQPAGHEPSAQQPPPPPGVNARTWVHQRRQEENIGAASPRAATAAACARRHLAIAALERRHVHALVHVRRPAKEGGQRVVQQNHQVTALGLLQVNAGEGRSGRQLLHAERIECAVGGCVCGPSSQQTPAAPSGTGGAGSPSSPPAPASAPDVGLAGLHPHQLVVLVDQRALQPAAQRRGTSQRGGKRCVRQNCEGAFQGDIACEGSNWATAEAVRACRPGRSPCCQAASLPRPRPPNASDRLRCAPRFRPCVPNFRLVLLVQLLEEVVQVGDLGVDVCLQQAAVVVLVADDRLHHHLRGLQQRSKPTASAHRPTGVSAGTSTAPVIQNNAREVAETACARNPGNSATAPPQCSPYIDRLRLRRLDTHVVRQRAGAGRAVHRQSCRKSSVASSRRRLLEQCLPRLPGVAAKRGAGGTVAGGCAILGVHVATCALRPSNMVSSHNKMTRSRPPAAARIRACAPPSRTGEMPPPGVLYRGFIMKSSTLTRAEGLSVVPQDSSSWTGRCCCMLAAAATAGTVGQWEARCHLLVGTGHTQT